MKAHIAMGLGAFGAALTHTPNFALDQIQSEVDHFDRAQKEAIDRKFEVAARAAERLKGTKEERDKAIANVAEQRRLAEAQLLHTQQMQGKAISDEALKQQLAAGVPHEIAKEQATVKAGDAVREEKRAQLMQHLNATRTVQTAKHEVQATGQQTPKVLTDTLTGKDLPVDPTRTDARKHNAAAALLPNVNGSIKILDSVLDKTKGGPMAPEAAKYLPFGLGEKGAPAADVNAEMTRFRSAYAAAKKESVGEVNAKELASAIPDPPSSLQGQSVWNAWRRKIESTREELYDIRKGQLANAGVPPQHIEHEAKPHTAAPSAPRKLSPAELAGGSFVP